MADVLHYHYYILIIARNWFIFPAFKMPNEMLNAISQYSKFQSGVVQIDIPMFGNSDPILPITRMIKLKGERIIAPNNQFIVKYSLNKAPVIVPIRPAIKRAKIHFNFLFFILACPH